MRYSSFRRAGWEGGREWGYRPQMSPFGFLLGVFIFFALLKSGLLLPLVSFGLAFIVFAHIHRNGAWGCAGAYSEKRKRGFGPLDGGPWEGSTALRTEKQKHDYDEYV